MHIGVLFLGFHWLCAKICLVADPNRLRSALICIILKDTLRILGLQFQIRIFHATLNHKIQTKTHQTASNSDLPKAIWAFLTGGFSFFYARYSTLLHLPPLRFHWVGGRWDRISTAKSDRVRKKHRNPQHSAYFVPPFLELPIQYTYFWKLFWPYMCFVQYWSLLLELQLILLLPIAVQVCQHFPQLIRAH